MKNEIGKKTVAFDYLQEEDIRLVLEIVYMKEKEYSFDQVFFPSDQAISYLQFLFLNFEHRFRKQLSPYDPFAVATSFFYNILLYCSLNRFCVVTKDAVEQMLPNWAFLPIETRFAILRRFQKQYTKFLVEDRNSVSMPKIYTFSPKKDHF